MRILHVLDTSVPMIAGYTSRSRSIVNGQRALGLEPVVLTSIRHKNASGAEREQIDGLTYYRTMKPAAARQPLAELYHLRQRILEVARIEQPDVIHAHSPILAGIPAWLAARQLGIGCVYEMRSLWEDAAVERGDTTPESLRYRLTRGAETFLTRRVDAVVSICDGIRKDVRERGLPAERTFMIPNGVDFKRFVPRQPDPATRARLGLEGKTVVGYIGTFFGFEGVIDLVDALAQLIKSGRKDIAGLIVGHGVTYEACRERARTHGLSDQILHPGQVSPDEVEKLYSVMDIAAYPRRSMRVTELVTPLKPLEAMAMEKAVIGSSVGGIQELVKDGETGLIHRAGDPADLADKILLLVNDPARRRQLASQGRKWVGEQRDWPNVLRGYLPIYESVARRNRVRVRRPVGAVQPADQR